jgi:hypothetical protein
MSEQEVPSTAAQHIVTFLTKEIVKPAKILTRLRAQGWG